MLSSSGGSQDQQQIRIPYPYNYHTFQELERFVRTMKRFVHTARDPHMIASTELFAERIRDADDFNERVRSSGNSVYVMLYTESGCPACMDVMPFWEAAAHELQSHHTKRAFSRQLDKLLVAKLNCGDNEQNLEFCVETLHTSTFPAIVLYRSGSENEYVFGPVNNRTASVHQLVQFALRSLGAYDTGAEHPSEAAEKQSARAVKPEKIETTDDLKDKKLLDSHSENENVIKIDEKPSAAEDEGTKVDIAVATTAEFSDSDLNMIKTLGQDFDVKIKDSDVAVVMLTREK